MYLRHLSSLQFLTYASFFAVVIAAMFRFMPGKAPPVRTIPYSDEELGAHDRKVAKYFVAGGFFLVLGAVHMVVKNVPWVAVALARTGYAGHLVRVPKPQWHLWKFLATGAAALTVGTVQGVIQVQPHNADWLYKAGHAGDWIDPISHAHINLVTGLTMLVAGALFSLVPLAGGERPSRRVTNACFWSLLAGSLAFYGSTLYLGFHEGRLVVGRGLSPEQAEQATPLHPFLIMGSGLAMFAAFWLLLVVVARSVWRAPGPARAFVLAGCGALAVGTLQGPVQAFPAVNELLDRGGEAGDVIVNLHAQLNMLAGLMVILVGLALVALDARPG